MIPTRRFFLKSTGLALVATAQAPSFLQRATALESKRKKKILVALFQRGAVDGLNMVVPYTDDRYHGLRPTIALPRPGKGEGAVIDLDGQFGLHPALSPLKPLWDDKSLAIVHACGSPDSTRSHFDAQDYMESGTPGNKGTRDGWLNRYLDNKQTAELTPLRAVSLGAKLPRSLQGSASAVALSNIRDFRLGGKSPLVEEAFTRMYGEMPATTNVQRVIHETSGDTFAALQLLKGLDPSNYRPADGAEYPRNRFGQSMKQIAQLIKADVGVEVAFADSGGWDTHTNEAPQLNNLLGNLGGALSAFAVDLGSRMQDVLVVTMSEFGRTARENGNRGTDHGHANAMFAIGGGVKGGKVYGKWPGLAEADLYEGRDLALTTDFRDVFAEALDRHMGAKKLDPVFPGYSPSRKKFRGFLKG